MMCGDLDYSREKKREQGCRILQLEADPNAVGFYEKMGMVKIGERNSEVDGQPRVLPIMEIDLYTLDSFHGWGKIG